MAASIHALISNPRERRVMDLQDVPAHKRSLWLPLVEVGNDQFDPDTQKKTGPVTTVEATRIVDTYTITDLTAQEISNLKDAKISSLDAVVFKVLFNHENRIRALKSPPDAAVTAAQFRAAIKALL